MATHFETYRRADGRFAWRLLAENGDIIATDGGQGYENEADCEKIGIAVVTGARAPRVETLQDTYSIDRFGRKRPLTPPAPPS